jgi:hypothetical protein
MFDIKWLEYTNPLEDNFKSVGDFFSRFRLEDKKKDILALDIAHRAILDDLFEMKEKLEDYYIRDKTQIGIKTDNFGSTISDIEILPTGGHRYKCWLEDHIKYRLGSEKELSWFRGGLQPIDRVVVRELIERQQELIESSEKLATEIIDLMSKGQ